MTPLDVFLDRLPGRVRKLGGRRYMAACPAHQDRSPSLSIREGDDGRVLIYCHAGCNTGDVLKELHLSFRNLFPERSRASGRGR